MGTDISKAEIRRQIKSRLVTLDRRECGFSSHKACVALVKSDLFVNADIVLSYMATEREANPFRISTAAITAYKKLAFPRCSVDKVTGSKRLDFYFVHGGEDNESFMRQFEKSSYGIWEPRVVPSALLQIPPIRAKKLLVVVPGVAFTAKGGRLGHGAGYYDRYLSELKGLCFEHDCTLCIVGLCFEEQVILSMPVEKHDVRMDYLVSSAGLWKCS